MLCFWVGTYGNVSAINAHAHNKQILGYESCGSAVDICTTRLVTREFLRPPIVPPAIAIARAERGFARDEHFAVRRTSHDILHTGLGQHSKPS